MAVPAGLALPPLGGVTGEGLPRWLGELPAGAMHARLPRIPDDAVFLLDPADRYDWPYRVAVAGGRLELEPLPPVRRRSAARAAATGAALASAMSSFAWLIRRRRRQPPGPA